MNNDYNVINVNEFNDNNVKTFDTPVFILIHCLRYEPRPTRAMIVTRQQHARMKRERREGKNLDQYIQRVTESAYQLETTRIEFNKFRAWYKQQIQEKYNVGPDFESNRWFMEQVRPKI